MPKIGSRRKKTRTHIDNGEELPSDVPRSIILKRGRVGPYLRRLIKELRTTMYPYTAINLKESKMNSIKDYLSIVDVYGLSHMIMVTNTEKNSYVRLAKMPRGPTITLKVDNYCLASDIFEYKTELFQEKPHRYIPKPLTKSFNHVPLVIMNGFNSPKISEEYTEAVKITAMLLQSFFPPINLNEIQLKKCKRVVLFNLTFEEKEGRLVPVIEFRHFDIDIEKHSIKKTISNIINYKKTDLSKFENIADYILKQSGYTSGSDMEDPNMGLCEVIGDKEIKSEAPKEDNEKIKIKLHEIGPRINLKIQKIEEGFLKGNVTFHCHLKKSKKEIKDMMDKIRDKKKIKKERKKEQEENVNKKREEMTDEQKEHEEQGIKNKNKIYLFRSQEKERKITESQTKERRRKTKRKRRSHSYDQKQFETFTKTEARQKINKI